MPSCLPEILPWASLPLPEAWPDRLNLWNPRDAWRLARHALGLSRRPVELPDNLPGAANIPRYILQEFHNLPNGNYSCRFTRGYITGFDRIMLGEIRRSQRRIARELARDPAIKNGAVLDLGCGGGGLAGALQQSGIAEVWGLDPSPYLLQHAARDWPGVRFVQGVAESTRFADGQFHALTACFLFHEIPPRYLVTCLKECARILQPGGLLAASEPSPVHVQQSWPQLLRHHGWRGAYFRLLARWVHEPFLHAWHRQDLQVLLDQCGFDLLQDEHGMPVRHFLARKR